MALKSFLPKVVFDTNIIVSATLFGNGQMSAVRLAWQTGRVVPIVSKETSAELLRVLAYKKFKLTEVDIARVLALYLPYAQAHVIERSATHTSQIPLCRDARDQIFLDLAQSAKPDFLVSGDEDLLCMDDPKKAILKFRIIKPAVLIQRF